jgi:hypothetical protein
MDKVEVSWKEKCPVCKSGKIESRVKKGFLGLHTGVALICNNCNAIFSLDGQKYLYYKLEDVPNKDYPTWREYQKQSLSSDEWKRISYGGISDAKQRGLDIEKSTAERKHDIEQWMIGFKEGKVSIKFQIEGRGSSVILKSKEELQLLIPSISLWEARSIRTGGYRGHSFRVVKGWTYHTGNFSSQSHDELKELDRGRLTLTNKRLVFTGARRSVEINLAKINSIEPYTDGISVITSGRAKAQYFAGINLKQLTTTITVNGKDYDEPFTGLMLKYMIEGLIKRGAE